LVLLGRVAHRDQHTDPITVQKHHVGEIDVNDRRLVTCHDFEQPQCQCRAVARSISPVTASRTESGAGKLS